MMSIAMSVWHVTDAYFIWFAFGDTSDVMIIIINSESDRRTKKAVEFVFRLRGTSHTAHPAANTQWYLDFSPNGDVDGKQKVNNKSSPSKSVGHSYKKMRRAVDLNWDVSLQMGGIWKINCPREFIEIMAASLIRPGLGRKWKPSLIVCNAVSWTVWHTHAN